ncbi:MAG: tetratricopeptide repeat protein [Gammaproteobacteria bacterium]
MNVLAEIRERASRHQAHGEYVEAEQCLRGAATLIERQLGLDHEDLACLLNDLADARYAQGKYDKDTEHLYHRAADILAKANRPDHPDVANVLNNLASLHQVRGDYRKAEASSRRSVSILEDIFGTKRDVLAVLYRQSLGLREKILGAEHPQVATSLNNLAMLYRNVQNYHEAGRYFQRALAILEKTCGTKHPNTVACRKNYAALLRHRVAS